MSYDVSVEVPTGPANTVEVFERNYTSNCSWMWTECLDLPETPAGCGPEAAMRGKADEYRQREPENGWGNYDGALDFLTAIAQAAADHPLGVIRVWA